MGARCAAGHNQRQSALVDTESQYHYDSFRLLFAVDLLMSIESTATLRLDDPGCDQYLCRCLQLTEADVAETVAALGLRTLDEVRRCTGAGDGCTACHRRLRACIERHASLDGVSSALPICYDR